MSTTPTDWNAVTKQVFGEQAPPVDQVVQGNDWGAITKAVTTSEPGVFNQALAGLQAGLPQAKQRIGAGLEAIGKSIPTFGLGDHPLVRLGQEMQVGEHDIPEPRIGRLEDVKSTGDFADYIAYQLGNNIPTMGASMVGGALGAAAGSVGGPPGMAVGGALGAGFMSELINAGDIYAELKEKGTDRPTAALLSGLPIAILDSITPIKAGGRLFFKPAKEAITEAEKALWKRMAVSAGTSFLEEGLTEGAQEAIQAGEVSVLTGAPFATPQTLSRILNATVSGAFMGGILGAGTPERTILPSDQQIKTQENASVRVDPVELVTGEPKEILNAIPEPVVPTQESVSSKADAKPVMTEPEAPPTIPPPTTQVSPIESTLAGDQYALFEDGTPVIDPPGFDMPPAEGVEAALGIEDMMKEAGIPAGDLKEVKQDFPKFSKFVQNAYTLIQIAARYPGHLPLQNYLSLMRSFWTSKTQVTQEANQVMVQWDKIGKDRSSVLTDFIFDVAEDSRRRGRKLTDQELAAKVQKIGLDDSSIEVYKAIDNQFRSTNQRLENLLVNEALRNIEDPAVAQEVETQIRDDFKQMRDRNYFPFSRFGKEVIRIKAKTDTVFEGHKYKQGELVHMETFEYKGDRDRRLGELKDQFGDKSFAVATDTLDDSAYSFQGFPPTLMASLMKSLNLTEEQRTQLKESVADMLPARSFVKHMKKKRGVAGYSRDAKRAYATYFQEASNHIAKLEYKWALESSVGEAARIANTTYEGDAHTPREISMYMRRHLDNVFQPGNELAAMRSWVFNFFFAFVPKQAVVNLTQVPMLAYPYLSARLTDLGKIKNGVSDAIVVKELARAMKDVSKSFNLREMLKAGKRGADVAFDPASKTFTPRERMMFGRLMQAGVIDESFASELAAVAGGGAPQRLIPYLDAANRWARDMTDFGMIPFKVSEQFNRRVTSLSALRIAERLGMSDDASFEFARDAVETTMFEYARWNRPQITRGKKAIFFLFKTYMQHQLYFMFAGKGRARAWLMALTMGGLAGLPGAEDLLDIIDMGGTWFKRFFGLKNPKVDLRKEIRKVVIEAGANPDTFMHGLGRSSFGLHNIGAMAGTPWLTPEFDFSGSLSAGRVVPGLEALTQAAQGQMGSNELIARGAEQAFGPIGGIGGNMLRGLVDNSRDGIARLSYFMPRGMKNVVEAARYASGAAKNAYGDTVIDFDPTDSEHTAEIIGKLVLGAQLTRIARKQEGYYAAKEAAAFYTAWKEQVLNAYTAAMFSKDRETIAAAVNDVKRFNRMVPPGFGLGGEQLQSSLKTRVRNQRVREAGLPSQRRYRAIFEEYRKAYPE